MRRRDWLHPKMYYIDDDQLLFLSPYPGSVVQCDDVDDDVDVMPKLSPIERFLARLDVFDSFYWWWCGRFGTLTPDPYWHDTMED